MRRFVGGLVVSLITAALWGCGPEGRLRVEETSPPPEGECEGELLTLLVDAADGAIVEIPQQLLVDQPGPFEVQDICTSNDGWTAYVSTRGPAVLRTTDRLERPVQVDFEFEEGRSRREVRTSWIEFSTPKTVRITVE